MGETILVVLLLALAALGFYIWQTYNKLVQLRNAVQTSLSQVETELQQRLDLVPALVTTVKGYASHERETLENVITARARALGASSSDMRFKDNEALAEALSRLLLLTENYPNLKADTGFLALQSQLSDIERRINLARRFFNESVLVYNNAQQQFPANLVARPFGYTAGTQFQAKPEAAEPPKFDF